MAANFLSDTSFNAQYKKSQKTLAGVGGGGEGVEGD